MAVLAQRLPIAFVPEQLLVPTMRDDVIHNRRWFNDTHLQALGAQRISPQVPVAGNTPFTSYPRSAALPRILSALYSLCLRQYTPLSQRLGQPG